MLGRLFTGYERALLRRPLATKCAMSVAVLGTADAGAQGLQHLNSKSQPSSAPTDSGVGAPAPGFELDMRRQSAVALYSLGFQGPFGHFWYNLLEHRVAPALPASKFKATPELCHSTVRPTLPWVASCTREERRAARVRHGCGSWRLCGTAHPSQSRRLRPLHTQASALRDPRQGAQVTIRSTTYVGRQ